MAAHEEIRLFIRRSGGEGEIGDRDEYIMLCRDSHILFQGNVAALGVRACARAVGAAACYAAGLPYQPDALELLGAAVDVLRGIRTELAK